MPDYYNVTTNVGDAEIANAIATNTKLNITHIAFGDGNGAVPTPTKSRTTLVREVHRQPVTKYERHPTIANWIIVETIIPSNIGGFWVREMGIIAGGKLISHGSHAPFEKVADPTGVSEYRLKFTQDVRDGNVVAITLDESLIYASQKWVNENYIPRNEIVDNLATNDAKKTLSAAQGKVLQDTKLDKNANAVSASKLETVRTISFSGAATGSFNFDGSGNSSCLLTLANSGVADGTYSSTIQIPTISVNAKGQITAISQQAIRAASTTQTGVVQLVNDLLTNDSTKALTAAQGKVLQDTKLDKAGGTATGDIKAPSFTGTLNGGNQTKSSTMTTDFAFLNEVTASGTSSFFYDNGSGKFFSPYTTGIVSNLIDGSYFIMGMAPTDTKVKVMNGVRRPDGSYQYLKNITLTDVNSINSMTDAGSFIWDTHKNGGWATGNLFKATPNTTKQAMQGAYGQADTCERIFMTINSTSPWEVGNGNGIWIDINGTYTSGAWRFANAVTFDEKITGSIDKAVSLISSDNRAIKPIDIPSGVMSYFTSSGGLNSGVGNASYGDFLTFNTYGDQSGGNKNGLFLGKNGQGIHHYNAPYGAGNWGASRRLAYTDNETFTGVVSAGGFSCTSSEAVLRNNAGRYLFVNAGNWGCYDPNIGNIPLPESNGGTGNGIGMASSAGRLAFPRAINGVTFDGTKDISLPIPGYGRYSINVLGSRALETTYTNSSGSAIFVTVAILGSSGKPAAVTINGVLIVAAAESVTRMYSIAVMHGDSYRFDGSYVSAWLETR